jgi:hypothetical protein
MGRRLKNPHSTSSLDRAPMERGAVAGVTIGEIEDRVRELYPKFSLDHMRTTSVLFAVLKEGCSIQKLRSFTNYEFEFLLKRVEWLRSSGLLFTGSLSTQYVLEQVPGSEALIERITGQKIIAATTGHRAPAGYDWQKRLKPPPLAPAEPVAHSNNRKEEPMNTAVNGAAEEAAVEIGEGACEKTPSCGKPANHLGRCKGEGGRVNKPRAATPDHQKSKPTPEPTADAAKRPGYFKIEFEDEKLTISVEGIGGREAFAAAARMALGSLGGSNG